jgi:hypothetical protein
MNDMGDDWFYDDYGDESGIPLRPLNEEPADEDISEEEWENELRKIDRCAKNRRIAEEKRQEQARAWVLSQQQKKHKKNQYRSIDEPWDA